MHRSLQRVYTMSSPSGLIIETRSFPRTRYQGSKRKLAGAIIDQLRNLDYTTVLDAFGGTGAVSYAFKRVGKPQEVADVITFLAGPKATWITGQTVIVDGGYSLM